MVMEEISITFYNEDLDRNQTFVLTEKQFEFALQGVAKKDVYKAILNFANTNGISEKILKESFLEMLAGMESGLNNPIK